MVQEGSMPDLRHGLRVHGRAPASPWQDAGYYTPHILRIVASGSSRRQPLSFRSVIRSSLHAASLFDSEGIVKASALLNVTTRRLHLTPNAKRRYEIHRWDKCITSALDES
jgi:hypothetical protein